MSQVDWLAGWVSGHFENYIAIFLDMYSRETIDLTKRFKGDN